MADFESIVDLAQEVPHRHLRRQRVGDREHRQIIQRHPRSTFLRRLIVVDIDQPTSTGPTPSTPTRSWRPSPTGCLGKQTRPPIITDSHCRMILEVPDTEVCQYSTMTPPATNVSTMIGRSRRPQLRPDTPAASRVSENRIISTPKKNNFCSHSIKWLTTPGTRLATSCRRSVIASGRRPCRQAPVKN